jgi:hypothetical protein
VKKVNIMPSLFPFESNTGERNIRLMSILLMEIIIKAVRLLNFVFATWNRIQYEIKTKAILKAYIFQRGIINSIL